MKDEIEPGFEEGDGTKLGIDSGFNVKHYLVATDKGISDSICPNINRARRVLADAIRDGGEGWILETVEHWQDKGATFEQIPLEKWD